MRGYIQTTTQRLRQVAFSIRESVARYALENRNSPDHVKGLPVLWWLALICLVVVAVHSPLLNGYFLNYDDGGQITQFRGVTHADWNTVKALFTTNFENKNSNPMYLSFVANWKLTPESYRGFAVFNLGLLVIVILTFYRFAGVFLGNPKWQLLATALFGVHSAKADVVGWQSARCHFMGMPFFLGAFVIWNQYLNAASTRARVVWYALAMVCMSMAMLNKTIFIAILPILVLFDIFKRRRINLLFVLDKIPIGTLLISIFLIGGTVTGNTKNTIGRGSLETVWERVPSAVNLISQYLYDLFVPGVTAVCANLKLDTLGSFFDVTSNSSLVMYKMMPTTNVAVITIALLGTVVLWLRYREPLPFLGLLAIGAALFPVLGFVPFWVDFAYRFLWIPTVFFCLLFVSIFRLIESKHSRMISHVAWGLIFSYMLWHSVLSFNTCAAYHTTATYWENCVKNFPETDLCYQKLSNAVVEIDLDTAIKARWKAIKISTQKKYQHKKLGTILADMLARQGKEQLASLFYERSLVWRNANKDGLKRAREYLKKHPITEETREAVLTKRWDLLW